MFPKFIISPFKVEPQEKNVNQRKHARSFESTNMDVGLRLLPQITSSKSTSNVLLKSAMRRPNQPIPQDFCYLKNCNLCHKKFRPDKDIYMYRGDQGFCSIECRDRQIAMDEMKEKESSSKQMVSSYKQSYKQCYSEARKETRHILQDLRMQRLKSRPTKHLV